MMLYELDRVKPACCADVDRFLMLPIMQEVHWFGEDLL